jgi:protoheme IX farnesyltransferase
MKSPITLLLGFAAFVMYNGIYTPMKRKTAFATIPGALIGVIPPILGWSIGNTNFVSAQLIALVTFLFIWQIPHFYFLLFIFEDDYRNAGFPVLTDKFSKIQISRIAFVWIITLVFVSTIIILTDPSFSFSILLLYIVAGTALLFRIRNLMFITNTSKYYKQAFMQLNMFVLLVLISVSINKFLI